MTQVLLIAVFVILFMRDALAHPLFPARSPGEAAALYLGSLAAVALLMQAALWIEARRLDRTGSHRAVRAADLAVSISRFVAVGLHAAAVLGLGWLDAVRARIGDLILLDELLAVLPALAVFILGWWAMYPIDRRLREAALVRDLDEGRAIRPMPGRGPYLLNALRHQLALVLVPVVLITGWMEAAGAGLQALGSPRWFPLLAAQFVGMALVLTLMPLVLRRVWHTERLAAGPLRERLTEMCVRQRVRVRELLVWGTHGTMINGAVMGFLGPVRYILLTDALLEALPQDQVEAVMAHELAHVKRRHMLWLAIASVSTIIIASWALPYAASQLWGRAALRSDPAQAVLALASLGVGLLVFGYVSRRFEWQADAFAVQHLSATVPPASPLSGATETPPAAPRGEVGALTITPEAASSMSGALDLVARLNRIPRTKFTWRHGSIAARQQKIAALAGRPAAQLPIDRHIRLIKLAAALALLGALAVAAASVAPELKDSVHALRQDARHR